MFNFPERARKMNAADWLIVSVTAHYLAAAVAYGFVGNYNAAGLYLMYAAANVFLIRMS